MLIGLNGATIMNADLMTEINAASEAGYDGVELRSFKIIDFLKEHTTEELRQLLEAKQLKPLSINAVDNCNLPDYWDFDVVRKQCKDLCGIARQIDCEYVVAAPPLESQPLPKEEVFKQSVKALTELTAIANDSGIKLGFEFLGFETCSVTTLGFCMEIIEAVNKDNLFLVIDTFHFYKGRSSLESLKQLDVSKLCILHINDAEDLPIEELDDSNRLFPGDGIMPLKQMLSILKGNGYDRIVSLEMFRPEYWQLDPAEVSKIGIEKTKHLIKEITRG